MAGRAGPGHNRYVMPNHSAHPDPKVCLHEGKKLFLRNQIVVKPDLDGPNLTMHFTRLPKGKILVGFVEETPF